jgi:hypothetical protein
MVPYENCQVLTLYAGKQGLPRAYAEKGPSNIQAHLYAILKICMIPCENWHVYTLYVAK